VLTYYNLVKKTSKMSRFILFLKLCRLPNLLIVFLSQAIPYFAIILPSIVKGGGITNLDNLTFFLITINTVLTTLGGYIINDIYDQKIDAINKPKKQIVGKHFSSKKTSWLYLNILILTLGLALFLEFKVINTSPFHYLFFYGLIAFLLFIYAKYLKCTPILGNLVVAALCAIVPLMLLLPEKRPLLILGTQNTLLYSKVFFTIYSYSIFAFLCTFYREMVKDLEDIYGDSKCDCRTLPVIKGISFSKKWALLVGAVLNIAILILLHAWHSQDEPLLKIGIGFITMVVPSVLSVILLINTNQKEGFHTVSNLIKLVMLAGLLLLAWQ
jgi:4-hydroxybenzoate polyprenyltransferase